MKYPLNQVLYIFDRKHYLNGKIVVVVLPRSPIVYLTRTKDNTKEKPF